MDETAPFPKVLLVDRGYDANAVHDDVEQRRGVPIIPTKKNRRLQIKINEAIYAPAIASNDASIVSRTPAASPLSKTNSPPYASATPLCHQDLVVAYSIRAAAE